MLKKAMIIINRFLISIDNFRMIEIEKCIFGITTTKDIENLTFGEYEDICNESMHT